jgi:hypothetical protein
MGIMFYPIPSLILGAVLALLTVGVLFLTRPRRG